METIPSPLVLRLDPNDENIILGIPDDRDPNEVTNTQPVKKQPRRSKIVLEKTGVTKAEPEPVCKLLIIIKYINK